MRAHATEKVMTTQEDEFMVMVVTVFVGLSIYSIQFCVACNMYTNIYKCCIVMHPIQSDSSSVYCTYIRQWHCLTNCIFKMERNGKRLRCIMDLV